MSKTAVVKTLFNRIALLCFFGLCLSACTTKMAYNFMDWAIEWKVQRLVKLHGEQKLLTQKSIKDFHQWHRTTQLPLYADYLRQLQVRLNAGSITAKEIHAETDKIQLLIDQSVQRVVPDATEVLSTLSDAQVKELLASVAKERTEYKEEYVDLSQRKRQKTYNKKFLKHAQDWLGDLSKEQKLEIEAWSAKLEPFESLNLEQQRIWEEKFAVILTQRSDKKALGEGLKSLMLHRTDNWQPELEKILDHNQTLTYQTIADLLNGTSDQQRRHLNKKIEDHVRLFGELAVDTKPSVER